MLPAQCLGIIQLKLKIPYIINAKPLRRLLFMQGLFRTLAPNMLYNALCLAARNSLMFDEIYWTFLDGAYYGQFISVDDRVERHLGEEERGKPNEIYHNKLEQAKNGKIDAHYTVDDLMNCNDLHWSKET